jgi:hypothetical protein
MATMLANRWKTLVGAALIVLAAAVAVGPSVAHGPSYGGSDFDFHFTSWIDAEQSFAHGVVYPRWANFANHGAGEPRFIFYPPLSWMLGGFLGLVLPWSLTPTVFIFLMLAATGLAIWALAREGLEDGPAVLAGCIAIYFGYALFTIYRRSAYAELSGGFWIPMLLLFALRNRKPEGRFWERVLDGSATPLALIVAGAWLSNGPVGLMASFLLMAIAATSSWMQRSVAPLVRAALSATVGIGLTAIYLLPAEWERGWASINQAVTFDGQRVENSWLFAHHVFNPYLYAHDLMLEKASSVAVLMFVATLAGGLIAWIRETLPGEKRWWVPLALIPVAVLPLQFPFSLPVWNTVPMMRYIQFPWRWLLVLESPMAIFLAAGVWNAPMRRRIAVIATSAVVFAAILLFAERNWFIDARESMAEMVQSIHDGDGSSGKSEYAPPGVRHPYLVEDLPKTCLIGNIYNVTADGMLVTPKWFQTPDACGGKFEMTENEPGSRRFTGYADHDAFLILPLRAYPAWHAEVNGTPVTAYHESQYGLMTVSVPQGKVDVSFKWTTTKDMVVGHILSGAFVLLLGALAWWERRLARRPVVEKVVVEPAAG